MKKIIDQLYPLIPGQEKFRSIAYVETSHLFTIKVLSLAFAIKVAYVENAVAEQNAHNAIIESLRQTKTYSPIHEKSLRNGNQLMEKITINIPGLDLSKIKLIGDAIKDLLFLKEMNFSDPEVGKNEIIYILPSEYILHFFIPKLATILAVQYESPNQNIDASLLFTHAILNNLLKLFEDICLDRSNKAPFNSYMEHPQPDLLTAAACKNKFLSYLLIKLDEKNILAKVCDCDPIYQHLDTLNDQNKTALEPIIQKLSYYAALHPEQSAVMKNHLLKNPNVRFDNKDHPFAYWLNTLTTADQLRAAITTYDSAFPKNQNTPKKSFAEALLKQEPTLVFSFVSETAKHIKSKVQDMVVEGQTNILIALIKQGYFSSEIKELKQYKEILKRIGSSPADLYNCYKNIQNRSPEHAEFFLKSAIKEKISGIEKWLATNHPEHIPPKKTTPYYIKERHESPTQEPVRIESLEVPAPTPLKKTTDKPTSKIVEKAIPARPQQHKANTSMDAKKEETLPAKRPSQAQTSKNINGFFQEQLQPLFTAARKATGKLLQGAVSIAHVTQKKPLPSHETVNKAKEPTQEVLKQSIPQSVPMPIKLTETTNNLAPELVTYLNSIGLSPDKYQTISAKYHGDLNLPSAKIELLMSVVSSTQCSRSVLDKFIKLLDTNLMHAFSAYFNHLSEEELNNISTINAIYHLLTSDKMPSSISITLKNILFFESKDETTYFISGKILEYCLFSYSAAVLYAMGNSSRCRTALQHLESVRLSNLNSNLIDFSAIVCNEQVVIKNILLNQNAFTCFPKKIMQCIINDRQHTGDYLTVLNNYFIAMLSLYESGWAGEDALCFYTQVFNGLVHILLNIKVLLPAISQYEELGHVFCMNLTCLLQNTFPMEFSMPKFYPNTYAYTAAHEIYCSAFTAECERIGINVLPFDTHFAAYIQLQSFSETHYVNINEKMLHLGQVQAIITASTCLSQDDFHQVLSEPNKPRNAPGM